MGIPAPREIISSIKTIKTPLAAISRGEIISSVKTLKTPLAAISRGVLWYPVNPPQTVLQAQVISSQKESGQFLKWALRHTPSYLPRAKKLKSFPKSSSDRERALSVQSRDEAETFTIVSRTRRVRASEDTLASASFLLSASRFALRRAGWTK